MPIALIKDMRLVKVNEVDRDKELGILKKDISIPNAFSLETPSKSIRRFDNLLDSTMTVNEITRKIDNNTLRSLELGAASKITREIRSRFLKDKLNLVIFNLVLDRIPDKNLLDVLSQQLYASSEAVIFLPTVKIGLLKEEGRFTDRKIQEYLKMMDDIINEIESVGNAKAFIGTIPLVPIRYSRPIVRFYQSKELTSFAIDANTKDIILNETDFRLILSEINDAIPLSEAFIYACNLGYPRYEELETRADDFLSIFAYVDVFGGTFKIRGIPVGPQKPKMFQRDKYSYKISASVIFDRNYNQREQLVEASKVREMIGEERLKPYVQGKTAVDKLSIKRLESIAARIRVH